MILFAAALLLPWCAGAAAPEKGAVPVIFETDMGNDIDDALALDLLYKGMDAGHIRLIGVSLNKRSSTSFEFIDLMNTWYGYPDIPIAYTPRAGSPPLHGRTRCAAGYRPKRATGFR